MSVLDRVYTTLRRDRLFPEGWGDLALLESLHALSLAPPPPEPLDVRWDPPATGAPALRVGRFDSPAPEVRPGRVWEVGAGRRAVLLLAATSEESPDRRLKLARALPGNRVLVLENPYYGERRPPGQVGPTLRRASDLASMFGAAVREAAGLCARLHAEGHDVVVAGFSMGGQAAAVTAALCPFPVGVAAVCAPHSGTAVFLDGALRDRVPPELRADERFERLVLRPGDVARYPVPVAPERTVIVGGRGDEIVRPDSVAALAALRPGATLRWVDGGHVRRWLLQDLQAALNAPCLR